MNKFDKNIDWSKFKFISREDCWYVEGTKCDCEFSFGQPKSDSIVEDNCGLFDGYTNETYEGYKGELPRHDGETCDFSEFDIYYDDKIVNNITYKELMNIIENE